MEFDVVATGVWLKFSHKEICDMGKTYQKIKDSIDLPSGLMAALIFTPMTLAEAALIKVLASYIDGKIEKVKEYNAKSSYKGIKFKYTWFLGITSWRRRGDPKGTGRSPCS